MLLRWIIVCVSVCNYLVSPPDRTQAAGCSCMQERDWGRGNTGSITIWSRQVMWYFVACKNSFILRTQFASCYIVIIVIIFCNLKKYIFNNCLDDSEVRIYDVKRNWRKFKLFLIFSKSDTHKRTCLNVVSKRTISANKIISVEVCVCVHAWEPVFSVGDSGEGRQ